MCTWLVLPPWIERSRKLSCWEVLRRICFKFSIREMRSRLLLFREQHHSYTRR